MNIAKIIVVLVGILVGSGNAQMRIGLDQNKSVEFIHDWNKFSLGISGQWGKEQKVRYWALGPMIEYSFISRSSKKIVPYVLLKTNYISFDGDIIKGQGANVFLSGGLQYNVVFMEGGIDVLYLRDNETKISVSGAEPAFRVGMRFYL